MRINYILMYCLWCYLHDTDCSKLNKLKNKFKGLKDRYFKQKQEPTRLGEKPALEYPGTDPDKLKEIRDIWDQYYDCLNTFNKQLGPQKSVTPEAVMVLEGTSVRFECKICLSPAQANDVDAVSWLYGASQLTGATEVEYGEHVLLAPEDRSLHLFNLQKEDSGQYLCQVGDTVTSPYFLQVVDTEEPVLEVKPDKAPLGIHAQPPITLTDQRLKIWTNWEQWSPCSRCGKVGKRNRFGVCTVTWAQINDTNNFIRRSADQRLINEETHKMLKLFKKGIPCRFSFLPKEVQNLTEVRDRKSELMVSFCKTPCPEPTRFEVRDKDGNVVETANNSAGIYSRYQGVPPVRPRIERRTIFEYTETQMIVLKCPGNLNTDTPVFWQFGTKNVNPLLIKEESSGRMQIDNRGHFVIRKPRIVDSNIYSCWQMGELAGTIRLDISKRIRMSFNHHIMLIGMVLVMGTFLLVFYRAFKGRKVHRQA